MTKYTFIIIIILVITGGLLYIKFNQPPADIEIKTIWVNNQSFKTLIADTANKRIKGLSSRQSLSNDWAMLFIFDRCDYHGFWMKDMNFPVDIFWLDKDKIIIDIETNVEPKTWPMVFYPNKPACYGLEINAGLSEKYSLKVGQKIMVSEKFQP